MNFAGSIVWPSANEPLWRLNWRLSQDPEGLVITHAFFRGRRVFWKASLPSLRVQYDQDCGPYKDPLTSTNMLPTSRCPGQPVCIYSYVSQGLRGLGIESYHEIGWYRLTHRWVFWEDGTIMPRLYSAGLQCDGNHRHHAYWRLDFDVDGFPDDLALEFNAGAGDIGWGPGWAPILGESSRVKNPATRRSWAVMDKGTGLGYHVLPGPFDGFADDFSQRDLWVVRYHGTEDRRGNQGSAWSDELDRDLANEESTDGQDIILWYCGHLFHEHAHGGDEWHHVGPDLVPFGPW
jgi:hypothetical protein